MRGRANQHTLIVLWIQEDGIDEKPQQGQGNRRAKQRKHSQASANEATKHAARAALLDALCSLTSFLRHWLDQQS